MFDDKAYKVTIRVANAANPNDWIEAELQNFTKFDELMKLPIINEIVQAFEGKTPVNMHLLNDGQGECVDPRCPVHGLPPLKQDGAALEGAN